MLSISILRSNVKHNHYEVNVKHVFILSNINHGPKLSKPYFSPGMQTPRCFGKQGTFRTRRFRTAPIPFEASML